MRFSLSQPALVAEARQQSKSHSLIIEILIFILVFLVAGMVFEGGMMAIGLLVPLFFGDTFQEMLARSANGELQLDMATIQEMTSKLLSDPLVTAIMLFSTAGLIAGVLLYCRAIEGRRLATVGLRRTHAVREYLVGLAVGAIMLSLAVGICLLSGQMEFKGLAGGSPLILAVLLVGFLVQGASEELLCRGYFCVSLARRQRLWVAILVSSLAFAALHLFNDGIAPLAFFNLALFGAFECVYLFKRGNIWGPAAIHSAWNFMEGNFYGTSVSGGEEMESVLRVVNGDGAWWVNGGAFGLEGGLAVTAVLAAGLVVLLLMRTAEPAELLPQPPVPPQSPDYQAPNAETRQQS